MGMTVYHSPIGPLFLLSDGSLLTGLYIAAHPAVNGIVTDKYSKCSALKDTVSWLDAYFAGKNPSLSSLAIQPQGTEFQKDVWLRLCHIAYGSTVTYGQLAAEIAAARGIPRMSAQAVGQAVSANPISIIIPCHRVIGAGGKMTGYAAGLEKKIWLLNHESHKHVL